MNKKLGLQAPFQTKTDLKLNFKFITDIKFSSQSKPSCADALKTDTKRYIKKKKEKEGKCRKNHYY